MCSKSIVLELANLPFLSSFSKIGDLVACVDIGGTRIKSATFNLGKFSGPIRQLEMNRDLEFDCEDWDPRRDARNIVASLKSIVTKRGTPGNVFISIPGHEISSDGRRYFGWLAREGVPEKLSSELERACNLPLGTVTLRHDTLAWGQGVKALLKYNRASAEGGLGVLAFGTGVAFSIVTDTSVVSRHLHEKLKEGPNGNRYNWQPLATFAGFDPRDWIHDHLGAKYFEWMKRKGWSDDEKRENASRRIQLLLDQLKEQHHLSRFVIGGGFAHLLSRCRFTYEVRFLTRDTLGFDAGFVPLIGLLS